MPCGPLAQPNILTPSATSGPLMAGAPAVRGPMVRPVIWPSVLAAAAAAAAGRRAPLTANASTSAPLLTSARSGRQKATSGADEVRAGTTAGQLVNRLGVMTVAALRDECRRRRLPTGGPKPNLIRRLQQNNFDASFNCVSASTSYVVPPSITAPVHAGAVQSSPAAEQQRPAVSASPAPVVVASRSSASSSPPTTTTTTTSTSSEARASLVQSQAIVARILSIRAAQRQRNAELSAAVASSTATSTASSSSSSSSPSTRCLTTSTGVVSGVPAPTVTAPPRAPPNSEVVTAITRTMCGGGQAVATPHPLNSVTNTQRSAVLTSNMTNPAANLMSGNTQLLSGQMMPLTADRQQLQQQQQQLAQYPAGQQRGQSSPGMHEELWRLKDTGGPLLPGRQQHELRHGHLQAVQGQNVTGQGRGEDLWRAARDTESQVTLCRQQQLLICELRRQLEQSRRALMEAQCSAGTAEQPSRRPADTSPAVQAAAAPADTRPRLQISASPRSVDYTDVIPTAASAAPAGVGRSFSALTCSSTANQLQQQPLHKSVAGDLSLSRHQRLAATQQHQLHFSLQPTHHTSVFLKLHLIACMIAITPISNAP